MYYRLLNSFRIHCNLGNKFIRSNIHPIQITSCRHAGHAKWQNISKTKAATDLQKGRTCSRYVFMVRKAIISNNRVTDPKLNKALADVLYEASKMNVPKATLERAIERCKNIKIISHNVEINGPGHSSIIAKVETENISVTKRDLKKALKKFGQDITLVGDGTKINIFQQRGFLRTSTNTKDGQDISLEQAEEAAINVDAEEVSLEGDEIVFATDPEVCVKAKGELEKQGFVVNSTVTELVAYNKIQFDEATTNSIVEVMEMLRGLPEVVDVYSNADIK